ncbi:hypothetical protein GENT11_13920 [Flavobacterium ammonificans]|uniref:Uncharacterized protein n=2 Tax=Flavobacterium ammonificans TaxID=1751056 RepID=A0ABN6KV93_9FLAO|nr:hypothetical protein GENT11_13920 [Flavobacterium ammonificans]
MNLMPENIKKSLFKLSGEDYSIISVGSKKIQFYFSTIGLLVLLILLFSFVSALYFTEHLFHNFFADIGVGLVWGYVVTNMYVLLLYTITPEILPIRIRKKDKYIAKSITFNISMVYRIFVVILLALIIAQPLNVLILKPGSKALAYDIKYLLATNPIASINSFIVIAIFLLPIYFKYSIRNLGEFYEKKAVIEKRIIEDDYKDFKIKYSIQLENNILKFNNHVWENLTPFLEKLEKRNPSVYKKYFDEIKEELINEKTEKYEYWADPPFRTIKRVNSTVNNNEADLLELIYQDNTLVEK